MHAEGKQQAELPDEKRQNEPDEQFLETVPLRARNLELLSVS